MLLLSAFLYFLFTRLYPLVVGAASLFSKKARKWLRGRFRWNLKARTLLDRTPLREGERLWMHCASLGEYEQGRPVLEAFKKKYPQAQILLSFFSPSGFEVRKDDPMADWVMYLPMDSPRHARQLLDTFSPTLVVFVKYEFWWYYLKEIHNRKIPLFLIAARFRSEQFFFKPFGKWYRQMLHTFRAIMVQDEHSRELLQKIGYNKVHVCGDPRIDRVLQLAQEAKPVEQVAQFCEEGRVPLLILGSTWPADDRILIPWINTHLPKGWKVLIAPHEITSSHIKRVMRQIALPVQRYTFLERQKLKADTRVLILDTIGLLASTYQYGRIAYVGGGFGRGIHNILEPAAFGLPVLFGPRYHKFEEAVHWVEKGAAFSVRTPVDFEQQFAKLLKKEVFERAKKELRVYLQQHRGAAACCLAKIEENA